MRDYRKCVGIMLVNHDNKVFIGQRIGTRYNAWQMPQGGIESSDVSYESAALRELKEETNVTQVKIIDAIDDWISYDIPYNKNNRFIGQKQRWFLMRFIGINSDVDVNTAKPEFSRWKWEDIRNIVPQVVEFKRDVYRAVVDRFSCSLEKNAH